MHFSFFVLASAVVMWCVTTILYQPISAPKTRWRVRVLLAMRARDPTVFETVSKIMNSARFPRSVKIDLLLECKTPEDTTLGHMPTPLLRSSCRVKHVKLKRSGHAKRLRRLVKHFIRADDDDDFCIVVDSRVELVDGWDDTLHGWIQKCPAGTLLTGPAVRRETDAPRFPTLQKVESASGKEVAKVVRGPSRPFAVFQDAIATVTPTVCWCSEWTASTPETLLFSWPTSTIAASEIPLKCHSTTMMTTLSPLVTAADPRAFLREDVPGIVEGVTSAQLIGLTSDADEVECIVKFGSVSDAEFRIKVKKDEERNHQNR